MIHTSVTNHPDPPEDLLARVEHFKCRSVEARRCRANLGRRSSGVGYAGPDAKDRLLGKSSLAVLLLKSWWEDMSR